LDHLKRIKRELAYEGKLLNIYKDTILIDNSRETVYDFIEHKGASAIIPIDNEDNIIMVRQYRNAIDSYTLEIPAGSLNPGEDNMTCAIRECEEETGYKPDNVHHLIDVHTTVAFCNELIKIYYSRELTPTKQNLDDGEYINVERHSMEELISMIYSGKITDAKTVAGLLALNRKLFNK